MEEEDMRNHISNDIHSSYFIDGMQCIVLLRKKAIPEINDYIIKKCIIITENLCISN